MPEGDIQRLGAAGTWDFEELVVHDPDGKGATRLEGVRIYEVTTGFVPEPDSRIYRVEMPVQWFPPPGWVALVTWPGHDEPMEEPPVRIFLGGERVSRLEPPGYSAAWHKGLVP